MPISDPQLISILNQFTVQAQVYSAQQSLSHEINLESLSEDSDLSQLDSSFHESTLEFETPIFRDEPTLNEGNPRLQPNERISYFQGGCHCQSIRFIAFLPEGEEIQQQTLIDCNCSICTMKGFIHWIIPFKYFALYGDPQTLSNYQFNTRQAQHLFCSQCGIPSFYLPRSHPQHVSINVRCLDDGATLMNSAQLQRFDGQQWETHIQTINAAYPIASDSSKILSSASVSSASVSSASVSSSSGSHKAHKTVSEDHTLDESLSCLLYTSPSPRD